MHWMEPDRLANLYRELAELLRPGGVLVNGDHLTAAEPGLAELAAAVERGRAERAGVTGNEEWAAWWAAVEREPGFASLRARRDELGLRHGYGNGLTLDEHVNCCARPDSGPVGSVWSHGTDHVLVALRY
jgi:SAM-dependent methyltransferase